jgi:hypothetical protein
MAIDEKGYGAIYTTTWWGEGSALANSKGWGDGVFYIYDVAFVRERAEQNGGYIESFECVSQKLRTFPSQDVGRLLFEAYDARCEADGGDAEARTCTINELNNLL